jgi:putative endonuclease
MIPLENMYYTYILFSQKDKRFYTGYSSDLRKRLIEHQKGQVFSTKGREPVKLIYYEACHNEQDARAREKYLKSGMGKRYLKNRIKRFLLLTGYGPSEGNP